MNENEREVICVVCPFGCRIRMVPCKDEECGYTITGHTCKKGREYAIKEVTDPTRMLTSTVKVKNGVLRRLPVRTSGEIPKKKVFSCMHLINGTEIEAPVEAGQVVVRNIGGTGVDIVASRSISVISGK